MQSKQLKRLKEGSVCSIRAKWKRVWDPAGSMNEASCELD
jgi:hypothetical protein